MVMIPVGNRTKHNFSMWSFFELYIRSIISAAVLNMSGEILPNGSYTALLVMLSIWTFRPLYIQVKHLFYSWRDAKHRAESDALSETDAIVGVGEQNG